MGMGINIGVQHTFGVGSIETGLEFFAFAVSQPSDIQHETLRWAADLVSNLYRANIEALPCALTDNFDKPCLRLQTPKAGTLNKRRRCNCIRSETSGSETNMQNIAR